jgi:hypothetical protein
MSDISGGLGVRLGLTTVLRDFGFFMALFIALFVPLLPYSDTSDSSLIPLLLWLGSKASLVSKDDSSSTSGGIEAFFVEMRRFGALAMISVLVFGGSG